LNAPAEFKNLWIQILDPFSFQIRGCIPGMDLLVEGAAAAEATEMLMEKEEKDAVRRL
jgi:hypothetical protein